jgi:ATP-binding cassette subfamily B protein
MSRWEDVATKSFTSMTALNFVQGAIIAVGVTVVLILAAQGVADKNLSLGDMIMIQALLLQTQLKNSPFLIPCLCLHKQKKCA